MPETTQTHKICKFRRYMTAHESHFDKKTEDGTTFYLGLESGKWEYVPDIRKKKIKAL